MHDTVLQTALAAAFGFCAALFTVLLLAPAVARRISALTWRQATRVLPQSSEEIAASRDHLRGQNAIQMRQLEMKMEAVAESERLLRIGQQGFSDRISKLTNENTTHLAAIARFQIDTADLTRALQDAKLQNAELSTENADRDIRLASLSAEISTGRSAFARQSSAFAHLQDAQERMVQQLETTRNELAGLRSKLLQSDQEARSARTEAKRHEADVKLANRKILALEGKLERSIRLMAEAEEKLERRDAELKRAKEKDRSKSDEAPPLPNTPASTVVKPAATTPSAALPTVIEQGPQIDEVTPNSFPPDSHQPPNTMIGSAEITAKIAALRPALRQANHGDTSEKLRLKSEIMDLAGRVTAEAAAQNPQLAAKIGQLLPGSTLADAILKNHNRASFTD